MKKFIELHESTPNPSAYKWVLVNNIFPEIREYDSEEKCSSHPLTLYIWQVQNHSHLKIKKIFLL